MKGSSFEEVVAEAEVEEDGIDLGFGTAGVARHTAGLAWGTAGSLPHWLKLVAGGGTEGKELDGGTPEGFGGATGLGTWPPRAEYDNAFRVGPKGGRSGTEEGLMDGESCEGGTGAEALAVASGPCPWSIVTGPLVCHFCFFLPAPLAGESAWRFFPDDAPPPPFKGQSWLLCLQSPQAFPVDGDL